MQTVSLSTRPDLLSRNRSVLLVIDLQERLAPAIEGIAPVLANAKRLLQAADRLSVPTLVTEQYPKGLGHTVADLQDAVRPARVLEKTVFGALADPIVEEACREQAEAGRSDFVILGTEAHVCVLQTAMQIIAQGWRLAVVEDACGSRRGADKSVALERLQSAGAQRITTEMVLFEWLERAATPEFRDLLPVIRDA